MLDTLKLTKRLEGAGLERQVAEAMAEAFAESTSETVATKDDLRHEVATLRAEIHSLGSALRTENADVSLADNRGRSTPPVGASERRLGYRRGTCPLTIRT